MKNRNLFLFALAITLSAGCFGMIKQKHTPNNNLIVIKQDGCFTRINDTIVRGTRVFVQNGSRSYTEEAVKYNDLRDILGGMDKVETVKLTDEQPCITMSLKRNQGENTTYKIVQRNHGNFDVYGKSEKIKKIEKAKHHSDHLKNEHYLEFQKSKNHSLIKKTVRKKTKQINKKFEAAEKQKKGNLSKYKLSSKTFNKFNDFKPKKNHSSTFNSNKCFTYKKYDPNENIKYVDDLLGFDPFEVDEENIIKHNENDGKIYEN